MPLSGPDDERQTYIGGVAVRRRGDDAGLEQGAHDGGIKLWNAGTLFHLAGSKGAAGFTKATQEVSSYQTPVSNLMKAIAAVIVLVGAFNVYFKMQNGDQDVKKTIMLTIGGCIAFIALSEALPLFFK